MNTESVDLIATDPPFKKGHDFHASPDSLSKGASFQDRWTWADDVHESWVDKITDDFPKVMNVINGSRNSYGDDMGAFLCFMGVRILEMRRVLKDTGSLYLHCDPTASHYLKELLDSIFGRKMFQNEIVWCYTGGGKSRMDFGKKHDIILRYTKSSEYTFNGDDVRVPYNLDPSKRTSQKAWGSHNDKMYAPNPKGKIPEDWWIMSPVNSMSKERTGYPTQKPLPLYERIIQASSNKGDMVLDPFCGCATTCVAAEKLERNWIGIDIWAKAHKVVIDRLKAEGCLSGPGDEREDLILVEGEIIYTKQHFKRTDSGSEAVPFLETRMKEFDDTVHDPYTNQDKRRILLERHGSICQGCGIKLHERYLELDHKEPRAAGGSNLLRNRILLCGPCNKLKRDKYTLVGLRKENKKLGYIVENEALSSLKEG